MQLRVRRRKMCGCGAEGEKDAPVKRDDVQVVVGVEDGQVVGQSAEGTTVRRSRITPQALAGGASWTQPCRMRRRIMCSPTVGDGAMLLLSLGVRTQREMEECIHLRRLSKNQA